MPRSRLFDLHFASDWALEQLDHAGSLDLVFRLTSVSNNCKHPQNAIEYNIKTRSEQTTQFPVSDFCFIQWFYEFLFDFLADANRKKDAARRAAWRALLNLVNGCLWLPLGSDSKQNPQQSTTDGIATF